MVKSIPVLMGHDPSKFPIGNLLINTEDLPQPVYLEGAYIVTKEGKWELMEVSVMPYFPGHCRIVLNRPEETIEQKIHNINAINDLEI